MKVLFISSGNSSLGISPIVKRQGESLIHQGIKVTFFKIKGRGIKGYLANIAPLKKLIKEFEPDIIHAHYSFSGMLASMAKTKPIIVSLMGSDVSSSGTLKIVIQFFINFIWNRTIVKSEVMKQRLRLNRVSIIPNGVNLDLFNSVNKNLSRKKLGWLDSSRYILFAANPKRPEKNFELANEAIQLLNQNIKLHTLNDVPPNEVPQWMNASDVVLLSSYREGSPNVIKEAMACNRPIVATNVGDIKWLLGNVPGHYLSSFDASDLAQKIQQALHFSEQNYQTKGRKRIMELGLDDESVAKRLIITYHETLKTDG